MVYYHNSISVCDSVDQSTMTSDTNPKPKTSRKPSATCSKFPVCDGSQSAAIDVVILIAVITACGCLFFPYVKLVVVKLVYVFTEVSVLVKEEITQNPIVYGSLALSVFCAAVSTWLVVLLCTMQRCGKPNCKGLRRAVEFDIQLETEECVKSGSGNRKGVFALPRVHHRELEAELKKMAPVNGRAVLVFRDRCGCSVRRLVVSGPKKQQRKVKK